MSCPPVILDCTSLDADGEHAHVGRMYDYYLGGAHNFAADRDAADAVLAVAPEIRHAAHANRAFLRRAVQHALAAGIRQFLDLGSGTPTVRNVHEIAQALDPAARIVYVDNDVVAVAQANALLHGIHTATAVQADIRDPVAILGHDQMRRLIDFAQPVAVLLVSVLHFIPGDLTEVVTALRQPMVPGSHFVVSHASSTNVTRQTDGVQHLYARTPTPLHPRSRAEIRALLAGLDLVHPDPDGGGPADLVSVIRWRPEPNVAEFPRDVAQSPFVAGLLAGVGVIRPPAIARLTPPRNREPGSARTSLRSPATITTIKQEYT